VLPFRNLSADSSQGYFAGGLRDEIVAQLYTVPALHVIGRPSVMSYAGPDRPPVRQIARELGAGSVVEGSVQVLDDRVRVNVQLTDPVTGSPIWAEKYERLLSDAFAVQSDIARQIVSSVGAQLSAEEQARMAAPPTVSAEAYLFYLQGREYNSRPGDLQDDFEMAARLYERALALDPGFALAHAALSEMHGILWWYRYDQAPARAARQRQEAEEALRLAPHLPEAHIAMAKVHYYRGEWLRAMDEYERARAALPNDAQLLADIGAVYRRLGRWDDVLATFERVVELDPRHVQSLWDLGGQTYRSLHRHADEVRLLDRTLTLAPDLHLAKIERGWAFVRWRGVLDTLRAALSSLPGNVVTVYGPAENQRVELALLTRDVETLTSLLPEPRVFVDRGSDYLYAPGFLYLGWGHRLRGRHDAARAAFMRARVLLDSALRELPNDWRVHAALGLTEAALGHRAEARREATWLRTSDTYRGDAFDGPLLAEARAKILAQAGDEQGALDEIERLLAGPSWLSVHTLRLDPVWDPVRSHPRFRTFLAKYRG
jgi:TolB-like protein/Tfp pilus assembly protein PilF